MTPEELKAFLESGEPIGWTVTDPDGNIVDAGTVTIAEMTGELIQMVQAAEAEE